MSCREYLTGEVLELVSNAASRHSVRRRHPAFYRDEYLSDCYLAAVELAEESGSEGDFHRKLNYGLKTRAVDIYRRQYGKAGSARRRHLTGYVEVGELGRNLNGKLESTPIYTRLLSSSPSHSEDFWRIATRLLSETEREAVKMLFQDGETRESIGKRFGKTQQWAGWLIRQCYPRIRYCLEETGRYDSFGNLVCPA